MAALILVNICVEIFLFSVQCNKQIVLSFNLLYSTFIRQGQGQIFQKSVKLTFVNQGAYLCL